MSLESTTLPAKRGSAALGFPRTMALAALALCLLLPLQGWAATELKDVQFSALPGNQVRIDLILSGSVRAPKDFSTDSPARIALDFEGVKSGLDKKTIPIGVGPVQSLVAVEASNRTRVVINLTDSTPYQIKTSGNRVTVSINQVGATAPPPRAVAPTPRRTAARGRPASGTGVRDIDFRRGPNGEGRVLITLPTPNTRVAVAQKGERVVVDIVDAALPSRLLRRLDVVDFGTPVVAVESKPRGRDVQVDIETGDEYEYLAYQADELFTVEFRPLTPSEAERKQREKIVYSGDRLSLNFQDIEVRAVLQLLADFTGLNLVASDTVAGNITLRLKNVPWDQALDIILKSKGLSMRQRGNVIMVAPTQEIAAQEKLELESQQQIEELAPLRSEFVQVNYANAKDLAGILKGEDNQLLTADRGNVTVDERTNTLLIQDTASKLEDIRRIVTRLDIPVRQVAIESRVVIANNNFARDLGVRFGVNRFNANRNTGKFNDLPAGALEGTLTAPDSYQGITINDTVPLLVDLPVGDPSGGINLLIGKVGSYLLQLELTAMQREGRGEIVSSPRVITSDQNTAIIEVGEKIPTVTPATLTSPASVRYENATLKLDVTPHITPDDRIIMDIAVQKDEPNFAFQVDGNPLINKRTVDTSVLIDNGETVVLGGVYEREKSFRKEQVPWLGDIPILGHLFKRTERNDENSELLIFVTPRILKEDLVTR